MNTVQEPLTNSVFPPPCSIETPAELHPGDPPTNKATTNQNQLTINAPVGDRQTAPFPANAYHVPPTRYAPKPYSYRHDDTLDLPPDTTPLPERCQFMFSDGRQCTMARSDIHPSLCRFHSEREDQLFGDPVAGGMVVGAALDLPELYSACGDLTTAAGVNRALGQVFRLLAQRRISRQEAATFGHLAQLLLRTISLARTESVASASENEQPMTSVVEGQKGASSRESLFAANVYPQVRVSDSGGVPRSLPGFRECGIHRSPDTGDELRGAEKSNQELSRVTKSTLLLPREKDDQSSDAHPNTKPPAKPGPSFRATIRTEESLSAPTTSEESLPHITHTSHDTLFAGSQPLSEPTSLENSFGMNTSVTSVCNSREISRSENVELKPVQNEHLQKSRGELYGNAMK
jgi:hypothetical protein